MLRHTVMMPFQGQIRPGPPELTFRFRLVVLSWRNQSGFPVGLGGGSRLEADLFSLFQRVGRPAMVGRLDPSRDLRLGLHALESGAIDKVQLLAAVADWASNPGRTMAEVLADREILAAPLLVGLADEVQKELGDSGREIDPGATVTHAGAAAGAPVRDATGGASDQIVERTADGRFQVIRRHARGGLGEVFLAFDRELNRTVAIKALVTGLAHDPTAQARFLLEAELTGSLEHPGIVPVYSLGRYPDGRPYYAMHLVQGETLRSEIERFHRKNEPVDKLEDRDLAFRRLLRSVIDASNAVAYAHSRGVVHRDLKPENIMLGRFGETLVVDWGLAKRVGEPHGDVNDPTSPTPFPFPSDLSMTQPGSLLGTPRYMSPEQAAGELDQVAEASDVYSLGAILYCVLVGHDPFPDGDLTHVLDRVIRGIFPAPRRSVRSVDPALEAICLKAMARNPRDRHPNALHLASELETWLADVRYRGEHADALSQVKASLARLCLERAHSCFDRESHSEGMLWLARALENAPAAPGDLERVVRTSLTGWHVGPKLLERTLRHGCGVQGLAFCPEGRRLATAGADGLARLWDLATGALLAPGMRHEGPVHSIALSPDGTMIATAAHDGTIRRWDGWTGKPRGEPAQSPSVGPVTFAPDGSIFAAPCGRDQPFLWNTATGKAAHKPGRTASPVLAIAFAPDGTKIAVAHEDGDVWLCEPASGVSKGEPLSRGSTVRALAFDASGEQLLTGSLDGAVRLWDISRQVALVTVAHQGAIRCVAFRPGGDAFATVDENGTARLWEPATGRPIGEPLAHRAAVACIAFQPDGTVVATGSADGTVRLWCAATGLPIGPPMIQGGAVGTLAFSPDGRRLATAGTDATVRCWKLPSPVEGNAERISTWVGVSTELEFDAGDAIRRTDSATGWDLRRRLGELGGAPLR
jgi:WD40 repeat protein/serine/threonine protein kinase